MDYDQRAEALTKPEVSIFTEAFQANTRLIDSLSDNLNTLTSILEPVTNTKAAEENATPVAATGGFSPLVNSLMNQGDSLSVLNSRVRRLIKNIEL